MTSNGDSPHNPLTAGRLRIGDRLLLDGYTREVVHVQRIGARVDQQPDGTEPEPQVRVSFVNGSSVTVPCDQVFNVATIPTGADR